nr:MAG TPA: hypothetical protein [Caudoviricetes sp.]
MFLLCPKREDGKSSEPVEAKRRYEMYKKK